MDRSLGERVVPNALRDAGFNVIAHNERFPPDASDETWLAEAGVNGWIVLTKDTRFQHRILELSAIERSSAKVFKLTAGGLAGEQMARIFARSGTKILAFAKGNPGPFIARVISSGKVSMALTRTQIRRAIRANSGSY